ncbi:MAG TPA: sugar phosphate isomerase/epimerase family protein, partial [Chloroflexota bacterium]
MIRISAFADEIAADLGEQITVLAQEGIHHIDLRGAWGVNVLDLTDAQITEARRQLDEAGIRVAAIGSPIGKVAIDSDFEAHRERFERAVHLAGVFEAPFIRIFSFYPPAGSAPGSDLVVWRPEILRRLTEFTARARAAGVTLVHENEKDIYGDTIAHCVDLLATISDPHFVAALDLANFIQCGEEPFPAAYEALAPWIRYVHVKDALADGTVTVAGEGLANWPALLTRLHADGYDGVLSLEPHLAEAGRFSGFSGP